MIELTDVTLVCVDGRGDPDSLRSMLYCSREIEFGRRVLFTALDAKICGLIRGHYPEIELIRIDPFDFAGYAIWILHQLHSHIETSHALITQDDGFVLNPGCWDPRFLEYDYIGAPWAKRPHYKKVRVGNGGFSLRSRRMLQATRQISESSIRRYPYEDHLICISNRSLLERDSGLTFAPVELAKHFSREYKIEEEIPWDKVFGFHGRFHRHQMLKLDTIPIAAGIDRERPLFNARESFPKLSPKF